VAGLRKQPTFGEATTRVSPPNVTSGRVAKGRLFSQDHNLWQVYSLYKSQNMFLPKQQGKGYCRVPSLCCMLLHCYRSKIGKRSNCPALHGIFFFLLQLEPASFVRGRKTYRMVLSSHAFSITPL